MSSPESLVPEHDAQARQRNNLRLGLILAMFIVIVFGITLWKFRPL